MAHVWKETGAATKRAAHAESRLARSSERKKASAELVRLLHAVQGKETSSSGVSS